jgi:TolB-like protein
MMASKRRVLESWKEISSYMKRSERTCRTWEVALGLPVHRLEGPLKARVFAYPEELDLWLSRPVASPSREFPIAVLPLRNLAKDPDQGYLADALTEGLITELGSVSAFRVISWRSVWRFKDSSKSLADIGRELGVKAVVDGSVLRSGGRVRISASLYRTAPERRLWSQDFEREMRDILDLQREIVRELAMKVQAVLTPGQAERLSARQPVVPAAYEAYMRGQAALRRPFIKANIEAAVRYFEEAIGIDGGFAPAFAELGWCHAQLAFYSFDPPAEAFPRLKEAARRAIELDPLLAEGHAVLASAAALGDWDWATAERHFRRALELNPNSYRTNYSYLYFLCWMGRLDEMVEALKKLLALDPIDPESLWTAGWGYFWARRYDASIAVLNEMKEAVPSDDLVRMVLGIDHWFKDASVKSGPDCGKSLEAAPGGTGTVFDALLAFICAKSGRGEGARETFEVWKRTSGKRHIDPTLEAVVHTGLGERPEALACLERGFMEHAPMLVFLKTAVFFDELRDEPRFREILRRMNFPDGP